VKRKSQNVNLNQNKNQSLKISQRKKVISLEGKNNQKDHYNRRIGQKSLMEIEKMREGRWSNKEGENKGSRICLLTSHQLWMSLRS